MLEVKEVLAGDISVKESLAGEINIGVKVISPSLIDLEVTPSKEKQTFKHEGSYGYDNVVVNGVSLQDKEVIPTKDVQNITSDEGYYGLSRVTVDAISDEYVIPSGELEITKNGTYDVKEYASTNINVPTGGAIPEVGFTIDEFKEDGTPKKVTVYGMTEIPMYAFGTGNSSQITLMQKVEEFVLPNTLTSIGVYAFTYNSNLTTINLPESLTRINNQAFMNCTNLVLSKLPNSLKSIGGYAFQSCSKITPKTAPKATHINASCFRECTGITQMSMPSAISLYGSASSNGCFYKCTGLKAVWIGSSVTSSSFEKCCFNGCTNLIKMFIDLPRATVETFTNYQYAFMNNTAKTGIIVCNDDEGFMTCEEFDAIDWSTQ